MSAEAPEILLSHYHQRTTSKYEFLVEFWI